MNKNSRGISKSVRVAYGFMAKLICGALPQESLPKPDWNEFDWFYDVKLGASEKVLGPNLSNASSHFWRLSRIIEFYGYRNTLIAVIYLEGTEFENPDKSRPNQWRVARIRYCHSYDEARVFMKSEWMDVEVSQEISPLG